MKILSSLCRDQSWLTPSIASGSDELNVYFTTIQTVYQNLDNKTRIQVKKTVLKSIQKCAVWLILPIFYGTPGICIAPLRV